MNLIHIRQVYSTKPTIQLFYFVTGSRKHMKAGWLYENTITSHLNFFISMNSHSCPSSFWSQPMLKKMLIVIMMMIILIVSELLKNK